MSQPTIPDITPKITLTIKDSLNLILFSIAKQEIGISQMIKMEANKSKYLFKLLREKRLPPEKMEEIIRINRSIQETISELRKLEHLLKSKLETVKEFCKTYDYYPAPPDPPPHHDKGGGHYPHRPFFRLPKRAHWDPFRWDPLMRRKKKRRVKICCKGRDKVKRCHTKRSCGVKMKRCHTKRPLCVRNNMLINIKINNHIFIIHPQACPGRQKGLKRGKPAHTTGQKAGPPLLIRTRIKRSCKAGRPASQ